METNITRLTNLVVGAVSYLGTPTMDGKYVVNAERKLREASKYIPIVVNEEVENATKIEQIKKAIVDHLAGDCGDTRGLRDALALFEDAS